MQKLVSASEKVIVTLFYDYAYCDCSCGQRDVILAKVFWGIKSFSGVCPSCDRTLILDGQHLIISEF